MSKKNTVSGKFAKDIKGFENQFISLKNSIAKDVGYDIDIIWKFDYNKNKNYYINYYINKIKEKLGSVQWN